jgi:hypothetical protein
MGSVRLTAVSYAQSSHLEALIWLVKLNVPEQELLPMAQAREELSDADAERQHAHDSLSPPLQALVTSTVIEVAVRVWEQVRQPFRPLTPAMQLPPARAGLGMIAMTTTTKAASRLVSRGLPDRGPVAIAYLFFNWYQGEVASVCAEHRGWPS